MLIKEYLRLLRRLRFPEGFSLYWYTRLCIQQLWQRSSSSFAAACGHTSACRARVFAAQSTACTEVFSRWIIGVPWRHGNVPLSSLRQRQHPDPTHAHIKTFPSASARRWLLDETAVATGTLRTRKCSATLFKRGISVPEPRANILTEGMSNNGNVHSMSEISGKCVWTHECVIQINAGLRCFCSTFSLLNSMIVPGDPADFLRGESLVDRPHHHDGAAPQQLPADPGPAGRRGRHQPDHRLLLLRALLRHLLQVLGAGRRPRPLYRPQRPVEIQRSR